MNDLAVKAVEFGAFILGYSIKGLIARWVQDHLLVPIGRLALKRIKKLEQSNPLRYAEIMHHFYNHPGELLYCKEGVCQKLV